MAKLSDTQALLLHDGAKRDDGLILPPFKMPTVARGAIFKALTTRGLAEPHHCLFEFSWATNGAGDFVGLRVTPAGLAAIGIDESEWPAYARPATVADTAPTAASAATVAQEAAAVAKALDDAPLAPKFGMTLREAAAAVLAAWDDEGNRETDMVAALEGPMLALRVLLAGKPAREPGAPRKPREGTKQETVLAMLRAKDGTTGAEIADATGWASHTVRGFLAGLKKRGINVVSIPQPSIDGAKRAPMVYRIG